MWASPVLHPYLFDPACVTELSFLDTGAGGFRPRESHQSVVATHGTSRALGAIDDVFGWW